MKTKRLPPGSSSTLEEESRRMEERLQMLKKMMSVEKASRELSAGRFWKSSGSNSDSQSPSQPVQDQDSSRTKRSVRVIRVLTNEGEGGPLKVKRCGQCDKPSAKLACIECVENYCLSCFAKFHQKGALSKHRVKPIKVKGPRTKEATPAKIPCSSTSTASSQTSSCPQTVADSQTLPKPIRRVQRAVATCSSTRTSGVTGSEEGVQQVKREEGSDGGDGEGGMGSLWEGEYDEKASAQSFQEALQEWRAGCTGIKTEPVACSNTTQACSTQTMSNGTSTQINRSNSTQRVDRVNFSKYSGGVSYLEKLIVRRHRTHPLFLAPTHPITTDMEHNCSGSERANDSNNTSCFEENDEQEAVPSRYNLFHSHSGETRPNGMPGYLYRSSASPILSDLPLLRRPSSSVQIEEVKFGDHHCTHNNTRPATTVVSQSGEKKSVVSKQKRSKQKGKTEKKCPHHQKRKEKTAFQGKMQKKEELLNHKEKSQATGQDHSTAVGEECSPIGQQFSKCVKHILQPHTKVGLLTHVPSEGTLSEFFLSGVKRDLEEETDEGRRDGEVTNGKVSKPLLPISATVWLPENSVSTEDKREDCTATHKSASLPSNGVPTPNPLLESQVSPEVSPPLFLGCSPNLPSHSDTRCNPLLRTSIYCIETDLPPPSCAVRARADVPTHGTNHSQPTPTSTTNSHTPLYEHSASSGRVEHHSDTESDSDTNGTECFRGYLEEEGLSVQEGYGEDSVALEELVWELQSMTGGRETRCEGEWEEEGELGEELEAEMERVKSSLETYHQQLMQQDSD